MPPPTLPMREALAGLERRQPRFPLDRVAEFAERYDYDEDRATDIEAIAAAVRPRGRFTKLEFEHAVQWTSGRTVCRARRNAAGDVEAVTRLAFSRSDERLRADLLRTLQGVDWPVASALLYVRSEATYPVLDWRALWALGSGEPHQYSYELWWAYVECCRELAEANSVSVRELDKALWKYWDIAGEVSGRPESS